MEKNDLLKFKMVESDIEKSVKLFQDLEKNPTKFICINNDLRKQDVEKNKVISALHLNFYLQMFPKPSKFEREDPTMEDPIHTKLKIKCSLNEPKQKIFCVENSGKRFDLNLSRADTQDRWERYLQDYALQTYYKLDMDQTDGNMTGRTTAGQDNFAGEPRWNMTGRSTLPLQYY